MISINIKKTEIKFTKDNKINKIFFEQDTDFLEKK